MIKLFDRMPLLTNETEQTRMIIQTRTHTATVTKIDNLYSVNIFANGITPKQIDERNWGSLEAAEKDARAMMKLGGYQDVSNNKIIC